ncbi:hypothetical protein BC830DRAFT_1173207 [Chytriomyces sp. MP71]|nr:hypothetical protein BC830DRAFT_1173207 [Chytriomyces sp. MP71]
MFDGQFKSKRGVSLGGAKKVLDKEALLRQTQLERAQREREKQRVRSAVAIQAFCRGRRANAAAKDSVRDQFCAAARVGGADAMAVDGVDAVAATRKLLFFYTPANKADQRKLDALAAALDAGGSWLRPFDQASQVQSWTRLLPRLLLRCLDNGSGGAERMRFVRSVLDNQIHRAAIAPSLVNLGALDALRMRVIRLPCPATTDSSDEATLTFSILSTLLLSVPPFASTLEALTRILAIPNFKLRVPASTTGSYSTFLKSFGYFHIWIPYLSVKMEKDAMNVDSSDASSNIPLEDRVHLLANLLQVQMEITSSKVSLDEMTNLLNILRLLLDSVPSGFFSRTHETTIEDDDEPDSDSDDDDAPRRASTPFKRAFIPAAGTEAVRSNVSPSLSMETLDAQTRATLSRLVSKECVQSLVSQCAHTDLALNGAATRLIVTLLYHWPVRKSAVLNAVTFQNGARSVAAVMARVKESKLWQVVDAGEKGGIAQFLGDLSLVSFWTDLVLVSEAFCHQLQIMTDKEFFETMDLISVQDVKVLSGILRNVLFYIYGTVTEFSKAPSLAKYNHQIASTFTSLLEQIHAREYVRITFTLYPWK